MYLVGIAVAGPAYGDVVLDKDSKAKLQADFRFRFESDWDSRRSDGSKRVNRDRARIRARLGLVYTPTPAFSLGFRIRSGSTESQQSPHITIVDFDDNPRGDKELLLDKWYLKVSGERSWAWGGRNGFPFWKQNEQFWDGDVTPAGVAAGYTTPWKRGSFALNAGYFALPDGGVSFNGQLAAGQAVLSAQTGGVTFTGAGGVFFLNGHPGAKHLRKGNGTRDYIIWVGNVQAKLQAEGRSLTLGLDVMHNSENYSSTDPDPFTAANHDQRDGLVSFVSLGQTKNKGDWLAAYYYAHIETLAVNASYAQDDWVRWGSAIQTDSSDLKGHEIRFAYSLSKNLNLVARLYLVEAITSVQDGKRFRLDLNHKF
ncbi:putative porin [Acidobacteria bacterium AH-259-D05]|nr:putative porin [Acidobacteria bacterium AH-259-D05]